MRPKSMFPRSIYGTTIGLIVKAPRVSCQDFSVKNTESVIALQINVNIVGARYVLWLRSCSMKFRYRILRNRSVLSNLNIMP